MKKKVDKSLVVLNKKKKKLKNSKISNRKDGEMRRRGNRQTVEQTKDGQIDDWMNGCTNVSVGEWVNKWIYNSYSFFQANFFCRSNIKTIFFQLLKDKKKKKKKKTKNLLLFFFLLSVFFSA